MTPLYLALLSVGGMAIAAYLSAFRGGARERAEVHIALTASLIIASLLALFIPNGLAELGLVREGALSVRGLIWLGASLLFSLGAWRSACDSLNDARAARAPRGSSLSTLGWSAGWLVVWLAPNALNLEALNLGRALTAIGMVNGVASLMGLILVGSAVLSLAWSRSAQDSARDSAQDKSSVSQSLPRSTTLEQLSGGVLGVSALVWLIFEYHEVYVSSNAQSAVWLSSVMLLSSLFGRVSTLHRAILVICALFTLLGSQ